MIHLPSAGMACFGLAIASLLTACGGGGGDAGSGSQTTAPISTIFAGNLGLVGGSADGTGTAARFSVDFGGLATDSGGNIYVADTGNDTIRKVTPAAVVTTLAGTAGVQGNGNGTGAAASFFGPTGVAPDNAGNVFVADTSNEAIRKVTSSGVVTTIAQFAGGVVRLSVATDTAGNVYVGSLGSVQKIAPTGAVSVLAGGATLGHADGTGAAASFGAGDLGIATDSTGNVYVADTSNRTIRKVTPAGVVTTLAGTAGVQGSADGTGAAASFNAPVSLTVDGSGNIYVADYLNSNVRKVTPAGVVTTAVAGLNGSPIGIAIYGSTLYVGTFSAIVRVTNVR
jgi:sugar lactone lactonase YvrE